MCHSGYWKETIYTLLNLFQAFTAAKVIAARFKNSTEKASSLQHIKLIFM
jgi:hypothetical protein